MSRPPILKAFSTFSYRQMTFFMVVYLAVFGSFATGWRLTHTASRAHLMPVATYVAAQVSASGEQCQLDSGATTSVKPCTPLHPVSSMPRLSDSGNGFLLHGIAQTLITQLRDAARLLLLAAHPPSQPDDPPPKQPPRSL